MNSVTERGRDSNSSRVSMEPVNGSGAIQVEVAAFKAYSKNTLRGFCDLIVPAAGLKIIGATLHEKNDERWIGLPARPYQDGGEQKWAAILDFTSKEAKSTFQAAALAAVDRFRAAEEIGF